MTSFETALFGYLLNSLWQIPLVFAAAWLSARVLRRIGPSAEHRIWVAALVLEVLLPACTFTPAALLSSITRLIPWSTHADGAAARIAIVASPGTTHSLLHLPAALLSAIVTVYACMMLYFAARLLGRLRQTARLCRHAQPIVLTGAAASHWIRCCDFFAVYNASIAASSDIAFPMTVGVRRRVLLLPATLPEALREDDLNAAIAHEFAHMRRHDFGLNLLYVTLALPIAWHPLLWLTRVRLEESREMVCDARAAESVAGSNRYVRSLLRLASLFVHGAPDKTLHAIGIFDANVFERRIMNLTRKPIEVHGARRLAATAACVVIGLGTCTSALALRMNVSASISVATDQASHPSTSTPSPTPPKLISTKLPDYPAQGRQDKMNGTVTVALIVNKDGEPTQVAIKKSLRADFDKNAIKAVRQYRFKPALLNGHPVEYPLFIDVNFQIF